MVTVLPRAGEHRGCPRVQSSSKYSLVLRVHPEALVQTLNTTVPCALLCSQPADRKTLLTSLECRSESPLLEERVEHHFSIPDGYYHVLILTESIMLFGHVSTKKAMGPMWPFTEHFICYVFGQWGPGMVVQRSLSLHLPMPFFLMAFSFASGSCDCILKTAMSNCWRYLSVFKSMYLHMIIFFWL